MIKMNNDVGWIGVDLDGTLARYDGWKNEEHIGEPILPMVERVKAWLAEGRDVRIFTARVARFGPELDHTTKIIEDWCLKHIGEKLPITNVKDFSMLQLWDDRCVHVQLNTGVILG